MWSVLSGERQASRLRAAPTVGRGFGGKSPIPERELLLWARDSPFAEMNRVFPLLMFAIFVTSGGVAQTPEANLEVKLLALIKEVQTQQAQMAENQKQIETKLSDVGETVRVARIYAGRSQ